LLKDEKLEPQIWAWMPLSRTVQERLSRRGGAEFYSVISACGADNKYPGFSLCILASAVKSF
jgi:hypothetical protein